MLVPADEPAGHEEVHPLLTLASIAVLWFLRFRWGHLVRRAQLGVMQRR